jgi:tetratricopeptide (TPR) repeat protein
MIRIILFLIIVITVLPAYPQAQFLIKLYDYAWSVSEAKNELPDYVGLMLIIDVINEGNQPDACSELSDIYLDCSNENYDFGTDIVLYDSYNDNKIIYPGDTLNVLLHYIVPKDADALRLKFLNAPEAGGKYITESFNKWKNTNRSKLTYFENLAAEYFSKKNYTRSIIYSYNAQALNPNAKVNFTLGNCYISLENYDLAIDYYNKSFNEVSRYLIYDNMGYAYLGKDDFENSLNYFRKAISESPQEFDPYLGMAIAYYYMNNLEMAVDYYRRAEKTEFQLKHGMAGLQILIDNEGVFYGQKEMHALNEICKLIGYRYDSNY